MAGTVKIFGREFKQWQVWAVVVGGAAVTYFVIRQHQAASSSASTSAAADPVDPITGLTTSQDIAQYGSVAAADAAFQSGAGFDSGFGGGVGGYSSVGPLGSLSSPVGATSGGGYASDGDWDQAVTAGLVEIGYASTDVSSAIGRYLAGLSLTPDQQNIVTTALGEFGPPPSGAKPVIAAPATGPATSGDSGSSGSGSSDSGSSGSGSSTAARATVSGGHVVSVSANEAVVGWTGHNAVRYSSVIRGPGKINGHTSSTTATTGTYTGLLSKHTYEITITPYNSAGQAGTPGTVNVVTK